VIEGIYYKNRTGKGQFIDLAQTETGTSLLGTYILDYTANGRSLRRPGMPAGNRATHPAGAPHGVYRCEGDDRWCAITVFSDAEWMGFKEALGNPGWAEAAEFATLQERLRNADALDAHVTEWTRTRDQHEVMRLLQSSGVAAGIVQDPTQRAEEDPQLADRGHIVWMEMEELEGGRIRTDSLPMTIAAREPSSYRFPPVTGEHNDYVYGTCLTPFSTTSRYSRSPE
jgi:crotonobetainyl-CoA:carnitine CoA-transferase CaiB-like acyl-CoA transferase